MSNFFARKLNFNFFRRSDKETIAFVSNDYPSTLTITYSGLPSLPRAEIQIYNLNKDVMSLLTFLSFRNLGVSDVCVECLNEEKTIFIGDIINSTPIYDMPDIYLSVQAMTDIFYLLSPSPAITYPILPNKDYAIVSIEDIAKKIFSYTTKALTFHDIGLLQIYDPRYQGSKIEQLEKLRLEANINIIVNYDIVNFFSKRKGISDILYIIDADSSKIVNQISNDKEGVNFTVLFDNNILLGGKIQIINNKINPQSNGIFYVYSLEHKLSNRIPDGEFFTKVKAHFLGEIK